MINAPLPVYSSATSSRRMGSSLGHPSPDTPGLAGEALKLGRRWSGSKSLAGSVRPPRQAFQDLCSGYLYSRAGRFLSHLLSMGRLGGVQRKSRVVGLPGASGNAERWREEGGGQWQECY
ncbi:hypothetical protein E2C01_070841 [Portunus trituberculatus]|uniref:Uncharacterized protein n=1 Tax=Portunus trituberculatus TaxID=210409 RepID=A0A5B7HTT5_PORTR|nr:hypothetical protein [Portunus trituberculatus]